MFVASLAACAAAALERKEKVKSTKESNDDAARTGELRLAIESITFARRNATGTTGALKRCRQNSKVKTKRERRHRQTRGLTGGSDDERVGASARIERLELRRARASDEATLANDARTMHTLTKPESTT